MGIRSIEGRKHLGKTNVVLDSTAENVSCFLWPFLDGIGGTTQKAEQGNSGIASFETLGA
jgi:hypothetical protein